MFAKSERSTFPYWFAHWCAFQMTALNLHIWRPRYLLHDIEKPWLRLFCDYSVVQPLHRCHSRHHLEWLGTHKDVSKFDVDSFIIDNECSRFTKEAAQETASEYVARMLDATNDEYEDYIRKEGSDYHSDYLLRVLEVLLMARKRLSELKL